MESKENMSRKGRNGKREKRRYSFLESTEKTV